jgi:RNA polymerase sigma factor (sigma-70 family)
MAQPHADPFLRHIRYLIREPAGRMTDGQLLERFLADRDEAAVEVLVRRYGPLVFGVCRRLLRDTHAAEDAFQATFLVLVRKAPTLDRSKPLESWLYTVAYRLALRARANEARRRACETEAARRRPAMDDPADPSDLAVAVEEELQRLPEKHRVPLVLCYLEGKTNEQAAQALGCPCGSMSWRLSRARDVLLERLRRRGVVCPAGVATVLAGQTAPAAVPMPLVHETARVALWFAAEGRATASASAQAVTLAKGVLKAMLVHKLKIAAGLVLSVCLLAAGTTMLLQAAGHTEPPAPRERADKPPSEPRREVAQPADAPLPLGAVTRLGSTQLRHGDGIVFAAYTPDGKALLTAGKDRTIRLWDLATHRELRRFDRGEAREDDEPEPPPTADKDIDRRVLGTLGMDFQVALSRDGKIVAANRGGIVYLWEAATGKKLREIKTGQRSLMQLVFSADGQSLLAAEDRGGDGGGPCPGPVSQRGDAGHPGRDQPAGPPVGRGQGQAPRHPWTAGRRPQGRRHPRGRDRRGGAAGPRLFPRRALPGGGGDKAAALPVGRGRGRPGLGSGAGHRTGYSSIRFLRRWPLPGGPQRRRHDYPV